ncbi:MAG: hypothetical protein EPO35_03325 [Acidobacteria bacterium]|nr:MAG: hypothetical protein EPO35_03325 [Acidobacteriota bacterium]
MFDLTRREWLIQSLSLTGAAFAAQLPPQFTTPATPACDPSTKPTPARRAGARQSGAAGVQLKLEGALIGLRCGLIAGASLTFSIGDSQSVVVTDAGGRYRVTLAVPKTATAPRVNLRVDVPKKKTLQTYLFLPKEIAGAQNAKDAGFDQLLLMKLVKSAPSSVDASFDIILDL